MIVRKLNFLTLSEGYDKISISIYDGKKINAVYLKNKGYCVYIDGKEDEMFLINTKLTPEEFKSEENASDKEDFINLIKILLDQIYEDSDIPEYEKQHHEFVFLKIMDLFSTKDVEIIDKDSELYKTIELGFIRFDIELLKLNNSGDN